MPTLGEVRKGSDIGKKDRSRYIWAPCIDCGKGRWVQIRKEQYPRCLQCASKICHPKGPANKNWLGKAYKAHSGYIRLPLSPDDFFYPMTSGSTVLEHRLVMAKHLNRCLLPWETVHHKGTKFPIDSIENRSDNRIENLELIPSNYKHTALTRMSSELNRLKKRLENAETKLVTQNKTIKLLQWQLKEYLHKGVSPLGGVE